MSGRGRRAVDLTDRVFGKWLVLGRGNPPSITNGTQPMWKCECECGTIKDVLGKDLRHGKSKQCRTCANTPDKRLKRESK